MEEIKALYSVSQSLAWVIHKKQIYKVKLRLRCRPILVESNKCLFKVIKCNAKCCYARNSISTFHFFKTRQPEVSIRNTILVWTLFWRAGKLKLPPETTRPGRTFKPL